MDNKSAFYRNIAHTNATHDRSLKGTVLILDPSSDQRARMRTLFSRNGYTVFEAEILGEALEIIVREKPAVIFTEIVFSDIDAIPVLRAIRKMDRDLVMIIHTSQPERRVGPSRRLEHIFEFIVKPASTFELIGHLKRALSFHDEKTALKEYTRETRERIHKQLEWLIWTEQSYIADRIDYSKSIVDSIKHTTTQGNGVGSLVTLLDMLYMGKQVDTDRYCVSATQLDNVMDTADTVRVWLDELDNVSRSLAKKYEAQTMTGDRVIEIVREIVKDLEHFQKIKDHKIRIDRENFEQPVTTNEEVIRMALKELLTNAFKFSPDGSIIRISFNRTSDSFSVIVLNRITHMSLGVTGIPFEMEKKIFEPFFKLNNIHDDRFQGEMFGMGTGLTVIQGAINQVGGKLYVYEAEDPDDREISESRIVSEMIFPIVDMDLEGPVDHSIGWTDEAT